MLKILDTHEYASLKESYVWDTEEAAQQKGHEVETSLILGVTEEIHGRCKTWWERERDKQEVKAVPWLGKGRSDSHRPGEETIILEELVTSVLWHHVFRWLSFLGGTCYHCWTPCSIVGGTDHFCLVTPYNVSGYRSFRRIYYLCVVTPCSVVGDYQCFRSTYHFYLQPFLNT
jgi:hypothetical protein